MRKTLNVKKKIQKKIQPPEVSDVFLAHIPRECPLRLGASGPVPSAPILPPCEGLSHRSASWTIPLQDLKRRPKIAGIYGYEWMVIGSFPQSIAISYDHF